MTDQEVNKIITDYMGSHKRYRRVEDSGLVTEQMEYVKYTESLDLLVPVWENSRIASQAYFEFDRLRNTYEFEIRFDRGKYEEKEFYSRRETLALAAAHATAQAIKELND